MKKMKIKNEAEDRGRISRVLDFRSKLFSYKRIEKCSNYAITFVYWSNLKIQYKRLVTVIFRLSKYCKCTSNCIRWHVISHVEICVSISKRLNMRFPIFSWIELECTHDDKSLNQNIKTDSKDFQLFCKLHMRLVKYCWGQWIYIFDKSATEHR